MPVSTFRLQPNPTVRRGAGHIGRTGSNGPRLPYRGQSV